jgi:hypothetical protein
MTFNHHANSHFGISSFLTNGMLNSKRNETRDRNTDPISMDDMDETALFTHSSPENKHLNIEHGLQSLHFLTLS